LSALYSLIVSGVYFSDNIASGVYFSNTLTKGYICFKEFQELDFNFNGIVDISHGLFSSISRPKSDAHFYVGPFVSDTTWDKAHCSNLLKSLLIDRANHILDIHEHITGSSVAPPHHYLLVYSNILNIEHLLDILKEFVTSISESHLSVTVDRNKQAATTNTNAPATTETASTTASSSGTVTEPILVPSTPAPTRSLLGHLGRHCWILHLCRLPRVYLVRRVVISYFRCVGKGYQNCISVCVPALLVSIPLIETIVFKVLLSLTRASGEAYEEV